MCKCSKESGVYQKPQELAKFLTQNPPPPKQKEERKKDYIEELIEHLLITAEDCREKALGENLRASAYHFGKAEAYREIASIIQTKLLAR